MDYSKISIEMMELFHEVKHRLKIDNVEITLIDGETIIGFDFVIFINTGADMIRIFHSGLEDDSDIESIVDSCRRNIYMKAKQLEEMV